MKPLLTLCMIVKNEAHGIARTLRSAKPFVDRWCILDTGSTDDTIGIVRSEMSGIDGRLCQGPFVDFATTRNALLVNAAGCGSEFLLLLDADDILEGGEALRAFLEGTHDPFYRGSDDDDEFRARIRRTMAAREAFYVAMSEQACEWKSARVVRASAVGPDGWHYVGAVHEVLVHPGRPAPSIVIPGVRIRHERPPQSREKMAARLERDAASLLPEAEKGDARATYYLALTYKRMGDLRNAARWFTRRVEIGRRAGFWEEVYDSLFELARTRYEPETFLLGMLAAHAYDPRRAEPLYEIARRYLDNAITRRGAVGTPWSRQPEDALAYLFARRAFDLPKPDALFVHGEVYAWRVADVLAQAAWWMGEHEIGERAARQAIANGPEGNPQLRENLRFYEERKR